MSPDSSHQHSSSSITPCAFGGQVGVERLFPGCGIARPGPVFNDLVDAPPSLAGGKRRRRKSTKKGMRRKTARLAYSKRRGKGGMARVGSRGKGTWRCVVSGRRCTRVKRGGGTKKGMRRKTGRLAYSKRHGKGGTRSRK